MIHVLITALQILSVVVLVLLFSAVIGCAVGTWLEERSLPEPFVQGSNLRLLEGGKRPYDWSRDEAA